MSALFRDHVISAFATETLGAVRQAILTAEEAGAAHAGVLFFLDPATALSSSADSSPREAVVELDLGPLGRQPVRVRYAAPKYTAGQLIRKGEMFSLQLEGSGMSGCRCTLGHALGGLATLVAACPAELGVDPTIVFDAALSEILADR